MTTEEFIVKDDTPTSSTYKRMTANGSESTYRDEASTFSNPRTIRVSHQKASSSSGADRTLVEFARVDDNTDGVPRKGSVHTVFNQPREGVTQANILLEWEKMKNHIDANIGEYIAGFFPDTDCP